MKSARRIMMAEMLFCVSLVLSALCSPAANAATIQVNPGGSITNALAATNPGDTVHVSAGTYFENVAINNSGTSSAYITLIADGAVVVNAGGAGKAIRVAANYVVVNGFECTNFLEGINLRTAHIKILNCNVHSGTSMSNPVAGSNGMTVNFNTAIDDIDIENTNFYFNDAGGADLGCNTATDVLSNIMIKNCKFYANNNAGGTDGIGIGHQGTKTNISLIKCEAYDNLSDGFDLDAPVYMNGCIAHDNDKNGGPNWGVGIKVWGHSGNPSVYGQVRLYNCLSYNNTQESAGGGGINIGGANSIIANCMVAGNTSYGGLIISSGATLTVKNTIFYNEHYSISADSDTSGLTFDSSNIIYNCSSNGALSATVAALAKTFDPQFVNPVDNDVAPWGNFHLQSASGAINAGVAVSGVTDDADGNPRPSGSGFDIGPYEFQSSAVPAINSASTASGTVSTAFSYTITASNSPTSFNASGLPAGLSINTSSGLISGTPTTAGSSNVSISATNAGGTGTGTLALTINAAGPNLGFETPVVGPAGQYGSFQYNPSGAAWTFSGQSGISANGSGFTSGNPNAPEGAQVAILQSLGSFSQPLSGFQAGVSYAIVFAAAQRGNYSGTQDFQVFLDNTLLGTFKPASTSYTDYSTAVVTPGAGSHTLKFVGLNSAGGDNTVFIDSVRIKLSASNVPPVIASAATATPNPVATGTSVSFSVGASDSDGDTLTYSWNFGDGSNGTGASTTHTFASAGNYEVVVTVNDGHGGTVSSNIAVTVLSAVAINSGGAAVGTFAADQNFSGGSTYTATSAINNSGVTNPAPQAVYQSERYGNFTYTVSNLTPDASYTVRLHFAEIWWNSAGQRVFNVSINGTQVLSNFDIFAATGGKFIATVRAFTTTATHGQIAIAYTTLKDNAKSSGIEIISTGAAGTRAVSVLAADTLIDNDGSISSIDLGTVKVKQPFKIKLDAPESGTKARLHWSVVNVAKLAPGVAARSGVIGGRPKTPGTYTFELKIKGAATSTTNIYTLTVVP